MARREFTNKKFSGDASQDMSFSNLDLNNVLFENCTFRRVVFNNITADGITFKHCFIRDSYFTNCDMKEVKFIDCMIEDCRFLNGDMRDASIEDTSITLSRFENINAENAAFKDSLVLTTSFNNCKMRSRIVYVSPVAKGVGGATYFCAEDLVQFFDGEFYRNVKLDEWEKETRDLYEEGNDDKQMICLEIMDAINYFKSVKDTERLRR